MAQELYPKWRQVCIKQNSGKLWEKHCCANCTKHCEVWVPIDGNPPVTCEGVLEKKTDNGWK